ncbi:MAG: repressor LexA [Acidobacteria bacterium]|nr:repressor LexA [Acidobacteriota bacterium]
MYLTKRQKETLDYIAGYVRDRGYAPTLEEIGEHFGLSSPATVYKHVQQLVSKGYLRKTRHQGRGLEIVEPDSRSSFAAPVLGQLLAGRPIEAVGTTETIEVPATFASSVPVFLLRVRGASLADESLAEGDLLIVEDRPGVRDGEVVLALLRGDVTAIGRYYRESSHVRLEPTVDGREPLYIPDGQIQVRGVITGAIRDYRSAR